MPSVERFRRGIGLTISTVGLASCAPIRVPAPPAVPASAIGRTMTRDDAVADLDVLMRTLENVHPDLYANRSRDSVSAARERLVAALPPMLSRSDLWIHLAPLVATFGDGHTHVEIPREEVRSLQQAGALVFPPSVVMNDGGQIVVSTPFVPGTALQAGDRLVSLNGMSADSLVRAWMVEESGESERFRAANVTGAFRDFLLIHSIAAPYSLVTEKSDGTRRTINLTGISQDSLRAIAVRNRAQRATAPNLTYEVLAPGVGYMNFRSMGGEFDHFKSDVADMFRRIAADSDRVLIVDLRTNGGGDSRLGDEFLRYITTTPYRMSAVKAWKMSTEYRSYLKTFVRPPLGWFPVWEFSSVGRKLMNGPDGKIVTFSESPVAHDSAQPFYSGPVCVLIGPQTFSSAMEFADAVKTYHLATLIGEETGGRPNGFGEVYVFRLPRSQLAVLVSSARYVRANGDTTDHRGVVPDIVITPSDADRRARRDPVLERAKQCSPTQP